MGSILDKPNVKKSLEKARELEQQQLPPEEEIVTMYKKDLEQAVKLQKLLKPAWWISDTDEKITQKRGRKPKKPTRK